MGESALGRGTAVEENKVKASSGDATPDFLDGKVGTTTQVVSDLLEVAVNPATDTVITAADEILFGDVTDSNNIKKDTVQGILDLAGGGDITSVAHAGINRDMTLTGTVAYTGLGFEPTRIKFYATVSSGGGNEVSWAEAVEPSSGTGVSVSQWYDGNTTGYNNSSDLLTGSSYICYIRFGANTFWGELDSMDADGFTITWARSASPTGTMKMRYLAYA